MYTPTFRTSATNVPILSKAEIDSIGEKLISDFCPQAMETPQEIDIDRFITRYLGMEQDFHYLSHCGIYLGMTVFHETDKVPVYNLERARAEYIHVNARTVIIDNCLLVDNQEHRYRFTAGHEAAHGILHSEYFAVEPSQLSSYSEYSPMVQCRVDNTKVGRGYGDRLTDSGWMEWQANCLSSAILMPRKMVLQVAKRAERFSMSANAALEAVTRVFNVSNEAAYYRLRDLGVISKKANRL